MATGYTAWSYRDIKRTPRAVLIYLGLVSKVSDEVQERKRQRAQRA